MPPKTGPKPCPEGSERNPETGRCRKIRKAKPPPKKRRRTIRTLLSGKVREALIAGGAVALATGTALAKGFAERKLEEEITKDIIRQRRQGGTTLKEIAQAGLVRPLPDDAVEMGDAPPIRKRRRFPSVDDGGPLKRPRPDRFPAVDMEMRPRPEKRGRSGKKPRQRPLKRQRTE